MELFWSKTAEFQQWGFPSEADHDRVMPSPPDETGVDRHCLATRWCHEIVIKTIRLLFIVSKQTNHPSEKTWHWAFLRKDFIVWAFLSNNKKF